MILCMRMLNRKLRLSLIAMGAALQRLLAQSGKAKKSNGLGHFHSISSFLLESIASRDACGTLLKASQAITPEADKPERPELKSRLLDVKPFLFFASFKRFVLNTLQRMWLTNSLYCRKASVLWKSRSQKTEARSQNGRLEEVLKF